MVFGIGALLFGLLIYGPYLWVKYVFWRHSAELKSMPGTGGELAQHLIDRFQLSGVTVVMGEKGKDHYNPENRQVSLSPSVFDGKSLTAVAVAAHEVGHAIQFSKQEPVSQLRSKYMSKARVIKKIGAVMLFILPIVTLILKTPYILLLTAVAGVLTMLASALMYAAILPEEYDASFNKALPILQQGYIPDEYVPAVRKVLRAAALTYFAGALADVIRLWHWFRVLR